MCFLSELSSRQPSHSFFPPLKVVRDDKNQHYMREFKGESLHHISIVTLNGANSE